MEFGLIAAGFFVGMLVGATGVGGGAVMTPLLIGVFHVSPVVAVGTDIVFAAATKMMGTWRHCRYGTVHWPIVAWLALGSVPAAVASVVLLGSLPVGVTAELINKTLGTVLVATAVATLWARTAQNGASHGRVYAARPKSTVFLGTVLGVLVPLTSVGAGALGAAVLRLLYPRLPIAAIVGTDIAHAVVLAAVSGVGHWRLGSVDPVLLVTLLAGSLPGIYLGSRLGVELSEKVTRPLLAGLLALVGVNLVV